jgi:hypothetical protein
MNNCVGRNNLRTFTLFLMLTAACCALRAWHEWPLARLLFFHHGLAPAPYEVWERVQDQGPFHVLFAFMVHVALALALGAMSTWELWLLGQGQSTIDFLLTLPPDLGSGGRPLPLTLAQRWTNIHRILTANGQIPLGWVCLPCIPPALPVLPVPLPP